MVTGGLRVIPAGNGNLTLEVDLGTRVICVALPQGEAETFTLQLIHALGGDAVALDVVRSFLAGVCIVSQIHNQIRGTEKARTISEWAQEGVNQPDEQLARVLEVGRETMEAAAELENDGGTPCGMCKRCRDERERGGCN